MHGEVIDLNTERERQVVEKRIAGRSARKVGLMFGLTPVLVDEIVQRHLPTIDVAAERGLMLERLAVIETVFQDRVANSGDIRAVELLLTVLEFRARLLSLFPKPGVDAGPPERQETTTERIRRVLDQLAEQSRPPPPPD